MLELFLTFVKIGLFTFGGGYAMISLIEDVCVEKHYINSLRIRKACEMLTYTDLFISEIAAMNGFGSISQFNRVFQAQKGMTPSQYRRKADH